MANRSLTGGGRFAWIPAVLLTDTRLSIQARWLFALLASHANKQGYCWRSLARIAEAEGVSKRSVQRWIRELEIEGWVVRYSNPGKVCKFRVIRPTNQVHESHDHGDTYVTSPATRKSSSKPNGGDTRVTRTNINKNPEQEEQALDKPTIGSDGQVDHARQAKKNKGDEALSRPTRDEIEILMPMQRKGKRSIEKKLKLERRVRHEVYEALGGVREAVRLPGPIIEELVSRAQSRKLTNVDFADARRLLAELPGAGQKAAI